MLELLKTLILVSGGLFALTLVLLAKPDSKLREFLAPYLGWLIAAASGLYIASPVDILPEAVLGPFGLPDDLLAFCALVGGVYLALANRKAADKPDVLIDGPGGDTPPRRPAGVPRLLEDARQDRTR